ncbi:hypothetical protein KKF86_02730 [bacterium]|nr:hypothetical protein [bacterium]
MKENLVKQKDPKIELKIKEVIGIGVVFKSTALQDLLKIAISDFIK